MGVLFTATLTAAYMGRDGFTKVDETIDEVVAVLDTTSAALRSADTTLTGVGESLTATSDALVEAVALLSAPPHAAAVDNRSDQWTQR
jgi:hypothetical protein